MAKLKLPVSEALGRVQAARPLVQPNPTFMKTLDAYAAEIHAQPAPASHAETQLRKAFPKLDKDASGGLCLAELREALVASGGAANEAKAMLEAFDTEGRGELQPDEFVQAWLHGEHGAVQVD